MHSDKCTDLMLRIGCPKFQWIIPSALRTGHSISMNKFLKELSRYTRTSETENLSISNVTSAPSSETKHNA